MVLKRKCFERANTLSPAEFENSQVDRSFPKHLAVVIQIPTLHVIVLDPKIGLFLFTAIKQDAARLVGPKTTRIDYRVWFEECPEQIVGNFMILQEREKALSSSLVGCLDKANQEVQMLRACSITCGASICFALIRFQFPEVIIQQILLDLGLCQQWPPIIGCKKYYTVGLSSFRLMI